MKMATRTRTATKPKLPRGVKKWLVLDSLHGPVEVYLVPNLIDDENKPMYGLFYPDDMLILIEKNMSANKRKSTLLHEMMHLAFDCAESKHVAVGAFEEDFISCIEPLLFDVLRRNNFLKMP
jgi:Zn-dependent peptidase ImmA (M78 family)